MKSDLRRSALGILPLMLTPWALAFAQIQDVGGGGIRVFEPVYFTEFDPQTALDMVERLPGADTQESEGGRGLSGVRSNLLINGERPPPKGKSAREQLDEMPIGSVVQIELIDTGARLDIDMQGYPQVINVVTVEDMPAYYEVITQVEKGGTGDINQENSRSTQLEGTGSFSWGAHEFTVTGRFDDRSNRSPSEFVAIDPANPVQRVSSLNTFAGEEEGFQFDAMFALPGNSTLSFNSEISGDSRGARPLSLGIDDALDAVDESFDAEDDLRDFSTEYIRPLASNGELMVAFVDTTSNDQSASVFRSPDLSRSSLSNSETGETATRLLVTNSPTDRLTIRTNVSNAFNYFEGDSVCSRTARKSSLTALTAGCRKTVALSRARSTGSDPEVDFPQHRGSRVIPYRYARLYERYPDGFRKARLPSRSDPSRVRHSRFRQGDRSVS